MSSLVYQTAVRCKHCPQPIPVHLFSDASNYEVTEPVREEVTSLGKHYHWIHRHRVCAVCGELVASETLTLLTPDEFSHEIHPRYLKWRHEFEKDLLTVHEGCLDSYK